MVPMSVFPESFEMVPMSVLKNVLFMGTTFPSLLKKNVFGYFIDSGVFYGCEITSTFS